jgi:hypothetical protein
LFPVAEVAVGSVLILEAVPVLAVFSCFPNIAIEYTVLFEWAAGGGILPSVE